MKILYHTARFDMISYRVIHVGVRAMSEDLQNLIDKIRAEGVEKAEAEAKAIVDKAKAEAAEIVDKAKAEADAAREAARRDGESFAARAEQQVRQAMRDIHLSVAQDLEGLVDTLVKDCVGKAMASQDAVSAWVSKAVDAYLANGEKGVGVALGGSAAAMADTIRALVCEKAAGNGGVRVEASPAFPDGFTIRLSGGRVEHCFTVEAVADALSSMLRPEIAKLLKAQ
jgi:V/A-type H+-transporting ATPase subunit E